MAPLVVTAEFVIFGMIMFNLGVAVPMLQAMWHRRRTKRLRADGAETGPITRDDIREELSRDPVATDLFLNDHTPDDVQRYLYLEAERRAILRRQRQLTDDENDFFAPPRHRGPDPGLRGSRG